MKRLLAAAMAVAVLGIGIAVADAKSEPTQIKLAPESGSGETGTATFLEGTNGLIVKIRLSGGEAAQPAHIHEGTCDKLNPKPKYPLKTVVDGQSETTLPGVKLSDLMDGKYAVNVHKSTKELATYVACGNIAKAK